MEQSRESSTLRKPEPSFEVTGNFRLQRFDEGRTKIVYREMEELGRHEKVSVDPYLEFSTNRALINFFHTGCKICS